MIINKSQTNIIKKVGKADEPTVEELEFIYSRIPLLSNSEIVLELQDTEFPPRTTGSIKRRRKEYNAARKILEVAVKKQLDPATARVKVKHWIDLAEAAKIMRRNIKLIRLTDGNLVGNMLSGSIDTTSTTDLFGSKHNEPLARVDRMNAANLLMHLKAEFRQFYTTCDWERLSQFEIVNNISDDMLKKLDIVSHRRCFMGSCRVCEPWSNIIGDEASAEEIDFETQIRSKVHPWYKGCHEWEVKGIAGLENPIEYGDPMQGEVDYDPKIMLLEAQGKGKALWFPYWIATSKTSGKMKLGQSSPMLEENVLLDLMRDGIRKGLFSKKFLQELCSEIEACE